MALRLSLWCVVLEEGEAKWRGTHQAVAVWGTPTRSRQSADRSMSSLGADWAVLE